jgi:Flp pilus assembly protein TadG
MTVAFGVVQGSSSLPTWGVPSVRRVHKGGAHHREQRGSVVVEFALLAPLIFLILFGIIEFGFVLKDSLTLTYMTRAGARAGADAGNASNPSADYQILNALKGASGSLGSQIQGVIIFKATGTSSTLPTGCTIGSAGVSGECNVYSATQISELQSNYNNQLSAYPNSFGCANSSSWDYQWCPGTRIVSQSGNNGAGPDYLGVYVVAHHSNITGFFHSMTLTDTSVFQLEPQTP